MNLKFMEVTNEEVNWGKFAVGRFTAEEWAARSAIDPVRSLIGGRGWTAQHLLVLDLQTGEGAIFKPTGLPSADLEKHRIWVCPMFEPFLNWLYKQDLADLDKLPALVNFTLEEAGAAMHGYRRGGPQL